MAFNPQSSKTQTVLSEINVTPLVDVMLVLLIVFMISAPLMQQGIQVDLPKANAQSLSDAPEQIFITLQMDGRVLLNGDSFPKENAIAKMEAIASANPEVQVYIQADQNIPYGQVAVLMADIKNAHITRVGLVTEPKSAPVISESTENPKTKTKQKRR